MNGPTNRSEREVKSFLNELSELSNEGYATFMNGSLILEESPSLEDSICWRIILPVYVNTMGNWGQIQEQFGRKMEEFCTSGPLPRMFLIYCMIQFLIL